VTDIGRYGQQGVVVPSYYKVREYWPMFGRWQVRIYHIDEHGKATASGHGTLAEGERVEGLMTLDEAIAEHMRPAVAEAEANQKRWLESKPAAEEPEPEPQPAPMDPATRKFLSDGNGMDYEAWLQTRRRV
jgi:hypothetical protein